MKKAVKYPYLESQIATRGIRKTVIAKQIGCSDRALYDKLTGKSQFTWGEVMAMNTYFFPDVAPVDLMRTAE